MSGGSNGRLAAVAVFLIDMKLTDDEVAPAQLRATCNRAMTRLASGRPNP
jgi:hypothetical protein